MKKRKLYSQTFIILLIIYLIIPFILTLIYSLFTEWNSILPTGFTLRNYEYLFSDPEFWASIGRTLIICIVSVSISVVILLLTMFVVVIELPALGKYVQFVCMIPYALQGVILSISIISLYSGTDTIFSNRIFMLFGAYSILVLPYIYQGVRNNLNSINTNMLISAARVLGSSQITAFFKIIVPNILPGIFVSALLGISIIFGDFVLANNIAGNNYQNIQVYLFTKMSISSGYASGIVVVIFTVVFILTGSLLLIQNKQQERRK
jgi:putative spermidine/putrescine transport system permease protein